MARTYCRDRLEWGIGFTWRFASVDAPRLGGSSTEKRKAPQPWQELRKSRLGLEVQRLAPKRGRDRRFSQLISGRVGAIVGTHTSPLQRWKPRARCDGHRWVNRSQFELP